MVLQVSAHFSVLSVLLEHLPMHNFFSLKQKYYLNILLSYKLQNIFVLFCKAAIDTDSNLTLSNFSKNIRWAVHGAYMYMVLDKEITAGKYLAPKSSDQMT